MVFGEPNGSTPPTFIWKKWATLVHSLTAQHCLSTFFWAKWPISSPGSTLTAHTHLAKWTLNQEMCHKAQQPLDLTTQLVLHGKRFIKHFIFPLTSDVGLGQWWKYRYFDFANILKISVNIFFHKYRWSGNYLKFMGMLAKTLKNDK